MTDNVAIDIQNVCFSYGGSAREILHNIDLKINKGEFVTIVGPNGAGKTTLVRTMIGLNRPTAGKVLVEGKNLSKLTVAQLARTVGFLFQNPDHQLFEDTVYDEIASGPRNTGISESEVDVVVKRNMEFCGLEDLADRAPEELSIGEKKRTAVAAIMAMNTDILVLDEPTTGQTWSNLKPLLPVIDRLNNDGRTIVMITHNMDLLTRYGTRIVVVLAGKVAFDGNLEQLFKEEQLLEKAHLTKPPIYEISQHLSEKYSFIHPCFKEEELVEQIERGGSRHE